MNSRLYNSWHFELVKRLVYQHYAEYGALLTNGIGNIAMHIVGPDKWVNQMCDGLIYQGTPMMSRVHLGFRGYRMQDKHIDWQHFRTINILLN